MSGGEDLVAAFEARRREPGETVLAWATADSVHREGAAILTDRRLCFYGKGLPGTRLENVSVRGETLRYIPSQSHEGLTARFETDDEVLVFTVASAEAGAALGALLGKLRDLREAQEALAEAGYVPPPPAAEETPSAEYRLLRLRELLTMGVLGEAEYELQRARMIEALCREAREGA
jgi:hypothetical protein